MSIALSSTTPLDNASIQYTYPEMDIRGIDKAKDIIKFKFRNGLSSSSFSFTDVEASIFKSGIASEGIISKKKHIYNEDDLNITYELTIKHITSTENNFFYVVFPITSDDKTSFIKSIAESTTTTINIINMDSIVNKSLNSMIGDLYSSDVYQYTNTSNKMVFVFKTPIKTVINNLTNVKDIHSEWIGVLEEEENKNKIINLIRSGSGGKVSEEIVCDYSGDTIKEPEINNKNLSKTFSRVGSITIFFAVFALYTAFFYKYLPDIDKRNTPTEYGLLFLYMIFFSGITGLAFAFALPNNYKNINFLNIDVFKPASFYALLFIPLWDIVYKLMALFIYSNVYELPSPVYNFIFSYFKSDEADNDLKKYNMFLLGLLLIIWVLFVCVILVK